MIVLSARGDWTDRVTGIEAGADDYLPKPFAFEELAAPPLLAPVPTARHGEPTHAVA